MKRRVLQILCMALVAIAMLNVAGCSKYNDYIPGPIKYYDYEIQLNGKLVIKHTHDFEISDKAIHITTYGAWYKDPILAPWDMSVYPVHQEWVLDTTSPESYTYVITNQDECDEYFREINAVNFNEKMLIIHFFTNKINAQTDSCTLEKVVKDDKNDITIGFCLMPHYSEDDKKYAKPMTQFVIFEMDKTDYNNILFEIYYKNHRGEDI